MKLRFLPLALSLLLLTGCGPKRIDGSSDEAFKKSLESMGKSLSEDERKELTEGIMALALDGMNIFQMGAAPGLAEQSMREKLNGKSFADIQAAIAVMKAERAAEQLKRDKEAAEAKAKAAAKKKLQIETEVAELEAEKAKAEADAVALSKFEVSRSRFYFSESGYRQSPTIELSVKNGLPVAVSRVYFKAVLSSPGRSIPWVDDTFNHSISGGLEPSEEATWKLSPNMFSEWGKAPKDRQDMVLTVELTKVDGPDGKALFDGAFRDSKKERLERLKTTLAKGDFTPGFFE